VGLSNAKKNILSGINITKCAISLSKKIRDSKQANKKYVQYRRFC
jgi:hypothetical protein